MYYGSTCTFNNPHILSIRIMATYWEKFLLFLATHSSMSPVRYIGLAHGWEFDRIDNSIRMGITLRT